MYQNNIKFLKYRNYFKLLNVCDFNFFFINLEHWKFEQYFSKQLHKPLGFFYVS